MNMLVREFVSVLKCNCIAIKEALNKSKCAD